MNQLVMAMFLMFVRVRTQHGLTDNDLVKDLTTFFLVFNAIFVLGLFVLLFFILNHFTWSVFQVESKQTNLYIVPNITKGFFLPIVPFANGYNDICSERQTTKKID
jgi:hypothetical protein